MDIDKNTIIGLLLIGFIILFTSTDTYKRLVFGTPPESASAGPQSIEREVLGDTLQVKDHIVADTPRAEESLQAATDADSLTLLSQSIIADFGLQLQGSTQERIVIIDSPIYQIELSTKGPSIRSVTLKKYLGVDSLPVQLVHDAESNFSLRLPVQSDTLDLKDFVFSIDEDADIIRLSPENSSKKLRLSLDFGNGRIVREEFTFYHDRYSFDLDIQLEKLETFVDGLSYSISYRGGLNSTEKDIADDMGYARVYAAANDEIEDFGIDDILEADSGEKRILDWNISWTAMRTKYFSAVLIPRSTSSKGVIFRGYKEKVDEQSELHVFSSELVMPYTRKKTHDQITAYFGPLEYESLKSYNIKLENLLSFGPAYIIRPLSKFVLWSIKLLHQFIPNYGIVIILFSIFVKIILHPLTKKSYQSMKEMSKLQPLMAEIREKYGKDPQRMNAEVMKLYKEHGVNPLGGCLPMILQLPLLWALFTVFRSTIEFRGAYFVGWIKDLSGPDTLLTLPFLNIPLNILPLFMGITMFLQQKATASDPKQKAMVYIMPGVLTFFFYNFPSGLNLYYALFNLLSIIQQKFIPSAAEPKKDPARQEKRKAKSGKRLSRLEMMRQLSQSRKK